MRTEEINVCIKHLGTLSGTLSALKQYSLLLLPHLSILTILGVMGVGKLGAIYSKSLQNLRMWWGEVHRLGMELPKVNIKKSPISRQLKQSFLQ